MKTTHQPSPARAGAKHRRLAVLGSVFALVGSVLTLLSLIVPWGRWRFPRLAVSLADVENWYSGSPGSPPFHSMERLLLAVAILAVLAVLAAATEAPRLGRVAPWALIAIGLVGMICAAAMRNAVASFMFDQQTPEGATGHIGEGAWLAVIGTAAILAGGSFLALARREPAAPATSPATRP